MASNPLARRRNPSPGLRGGVRRGRGRCDLGVRVRTATERIVSLPFGDLPGSAFDRIGENRHADARADIVKATGQATDLSAELSAGALEALRSAPSDNLRGEDGKRRRAGAGGSRGARNADKLAAFLGGETR